MGSTHDDDEDEDNDLDWRSNRRLVLQTLKLLRDELSKLNDRVRNLELKVYAAVAILEIIARVAEHYLTAKP